MAGSDVYVSFGGDSSELEAALAAAKAEIRSLSSDLRDLANDMVDAGASADSDMGQQMVELGGRLSEAKEHAAGLTKELRGVGKEEGGGEEERVNMLERMKGALSGLLSPIIEVKEHFAEMIELIAAAFAVEKIADWAAETTEAAEAIESEAAKLGVTIEQVETLQGVAKLAGADYAELAQQFERLQVSLTRVGEKASPAGEALRVLGLNASQLRGQTIDRQLESIAEAFSHFADGPAKTAAAIALLGRAGADMIPFLDKGREGIEELRKVAERTGVVLSTEMIEAMAKTREHISELSEAWDAASKEIYAAFNPLIDALVTGLNRFLEKLTVNQIREWAVVGIQSFGEVAKAAIDGFEQTRVKIDTVINLFERMWDVVSTVADLVPEAIGKIAAAVRDVRNALDDLHRYTTVDAAGAGAAAGARLGAMLSGRKSPAASWAGGLDADTEFGRGNLFDQARQFQFEAALNGQRLKQGVDEYTKTLSELFAKSKEDVKHAAEGHEGAAKPQVPQMALGGGGKSSDDAAREIRATFDQESLAAREAAEDMQQTLDGLLQRHQITMREWLAQSVAALDREQDAVQDAADKALASESVRNQIFEITG